MEKLKPICEVYENFGKVNENVIFLINNPICFYKNEKNEKILKKIDDLLDHLILYVLHIMLFDTDEKYNNILIALWNEFHMNELHFELWKDYQIIESIYYTKPEDHQKKMDFQKFDDFFNQFMKRIWVEEKWNEQDSTVITNLYSRNGIKKKDLGQCLSLLKITYDLNNFIVQIFTLKTVIAKLNILNYIAQIKSKEQRDKAYEAAQLKNLPFIKKFAMKHESFFKYKLQFLDFKWDALIKTFCEHPIETDFINSLKSLHVYFSNLRISLSTYQKNSKNQSNMGFVNFLQRTFDCFLILEQLITELPRK